MRVRTSYAREYTYYFIFYIKPIEKKERKREREIGRRKKVESRQYYIYQMFKEETLRATYNKLKGFGKML